MLSQAYQSHLARTADPKSTPGPVPTLALKEIALGNGTGGANNNHQHGDEALQVVLVPKDDDGSAVKVPGRVVILGFEIAPNGTKVPIGRWDVAPENLRRYWRSGLLATGYYLLMQWDKPPTTEKLRIAVRMTTLDGRVFETDRDVTVRPMIGVPQPPTEVLPPPTISERPAVRIGRDPFRPIERFQFACCHWVAPASSRCVKYATGWKPVPPPRKQLKMR